jgi:hypothetical protein
MRDDLPKLLTKKEVLALVPVSFRNFVDLGPQGPVRSAAHGRNETDVVRGRSGRVDQQSADANLQKMMEG